MPDSSPLDNRALLRVTLLTVGAMVGACVVVVGSLALVAGAIASHAVAPSDSASSEPALVPAANVHGTVPGAPLAHPRGARAPRRRRPSSELVGPGDPARFR